ncbi:hypothetical protein NMG60_11020685 [Bertholletia excelsa]
MERESEEEGTLTGALLSRDMPESKGDASDPAGRSTTATPVVFFSTFIAASGQLGFGCAVGYSSPAEFEIMKHLGLSTAQYSVFASIMTFGGMLGATINGKVSDLIGRRGAMCLSNIFCIIGWLGILFAKDVWWLDIGRLLMGFGYGIILYATNVYVAEITPSNIRGGFVSANVMMVVVGISLMLFIGNIFAWRPLAIFGLLPSLIQFLGAFFIPESPRWLAKVGRTKELEATLQCLRGKNIDIYPESMEIMDYTRSFEQLSRGNFLNLFQRRYAHSLIVGVGLMLLQRLGGNTGIVSYASSILENAGASTSFGTTAIAIVQILFTIVGVLLVDKSGRLPLLMVSAAGTTLGNILIGVGFLMQDFHQPTEVTAILVLTGILVYFATVSVGMHSIRWVLMSEIFPMNIRGSAGSLVVFSNYLGSWVVSLTFNFIFEWSSAGVFFIYAAFCGLTVPFVAKLVPETKGRSLEEIQASMTRVVR